MENKITIKKTLPPSLKKFDALISPIKRTICALIIIVVLQFIVFAIQSGSLSGAISMMGVAWLNILRNNAYVGIIALGMCMVIVSGGIDISAGSMMCAIGAFIMFLIDPRIGLLHKIGIEGYLAYAIAIVAAMALGFLLGEFNGFFISNCHMPAFIVTLGSMKIFRSVTQYLTQQFNPNVPDGFKSISSAKIGGTIILPTIYWIIAIVIMTIFFKKTIFGRHVVAIGSNEKAAKFSGIDVVKVKRRIYAICGVVCAISAIIYVSRMGSMDFASAGSGYEMDAIAATIVGGTAMSGGRGSMVGTFLGMLVIAVVNNILNSVGVPTFLCDAIRGAIIIFAVIVQMRKNKE